MKFEIDFSFDGWTKGDLIAFCYGNPSNVDPAIPIETQKQIQEFFNDPEASRFYVMDYNGDHSIFGKLVNLKEKFFEKLTELNDKGA
ncbi:MAG: hypothetical protein ACQETJ_13950 [Bacteroidota bacterium]